MPPLSPVGYLRERRSSDPSNLFQRPADVGHAFTGVFPGHFLLDPLQFVFEHLLVWINEIGDLDIGLPKMDGISVLEAWRRAGRSMPVLILTARARGSDKAQGFDAGADDYVANTISLGLRYRF